MSISKELFRKRWGEMDDMTRAEWLSVNWDACPEFTILVDNDSVIIVFDDEKDLDEPDFLEFDAFGYHLIVPIFNGLYMNAEFV